MTYLAQTLVTRSWYLSGIVSRGLQTVTGDQITDGLMLLNALLDFKQIRTDLIPFWTYIQIPLVAGQEYYFLPHVAAVESMTFNVGVVRYPMETTQRSAYFGSARVDNITTLPFNYNFNRGENGGTLSLYFLPDSNYLAKMMVKLFLNDVTLQTDLLNIYASLAGGFLSSVSVTAQGSGYTQIPTVTISAPPSGTTALAYATVTDGAVTAINIIDPGSGYVTTPTVTITGNGSGATATASLTNYTFLQTSNAGFDSSYIEYLRYELANYMCNEYNVTFKAENMKTLMSMRRTLMHESPPDLSMKKSSILTEGIGFSYADVNLGRGWRPS